MKKIIELIFLVILIFFLIPILFTKKFEIKETINLNENIQEESVSYDYKQYNQVSLLHIKTGEVEMLNLDTYLLGVVASEMPASFEEEALKSQAIVARTYTIYKIKNNDKHARSKYM